MAFFSGASTTRTSLEECVHRDRPAADMKDYQAQLETIRRYAAECALIRDLATDSAKRELFDRLAVHLESLANHVEQEMLSRNAKAG
jgi:hypothetical protein